jgi:hypothetical protein
MKANIIGINGRINHGKDEVAKIIQYLTFINSKESLKDYCTYDHFKNSSLTMMSPWQVKKMAYKLKQIASILLNVPVAKFEDRDFKDSILGPEWDTYSMLKVETNHGWFNRQNLNQMTVRTFLQKLGTEAIRKGLHQNTWANAFWSDFDRDNDHWLITDIRFPNEYESVKDRNGIVIKVVRDIEIPKHEHESETALDSYRFDYVINNNKDINHLISEVETLLKDLKII